MDDANGKLENVVSRNDKGKDCWGNEYVTSSKRHVVAVRRTTLNYTVPHFHVPFAQLHVHVGTKSRYTWWKEFSSTAWKPVWIIRCYTDNSNIDLILPRYTHQTDTCLNHVQSTLFVASACDSSTIRTLPFGVWHLNPLLIMRRCEDFAISFFLLFFFHFGISDVNTVYAKYQNSVRWTNHENY